MALTDDVALTVRPSYSAAAAIASGATIFAGALVGNNPTTGRLVNWADTAGFQFLGIAKQRGTGDVAGTVSVGVDQSGGTIENIAVAGVTAETQVGDAVYATSENTLTLTPTANVAEIGTLVRFTVTGFGDVRLFTPSEFLAL